MIPTMTFFKQKRTFHREQSNCRNYITNILHWNINLTAQWEFCFGRGEWLPMDFDVLNKSLRKILFIEMYQRKWLCVNNTGEIDSI